MEPIFFATPADFRAWLERNHDTARELFVGFYKKASGKPTMTWSEAVDQALCFGWIDGVRRSLDAESYTNRFTPRRPGSNWSAVNIRKVEEMTKAGLMQPAGLAAFDRRKEAHSSYSYEQRYEARLTAEQEQQFRADPKAWEYFQSQPPSYRQAAIWWVVSAKREETRARRLAALISDSANLRRVGVLLPPSKKLSP